MRRDFSRWLVLRCLWRSIKILALVGAMMLLVGIELGRVVLKLKGWRLRTAVFTAALSLVTNMAVGFGAGLAVAYLVRELRRRDLLPCACSKS